MSDAPPWLLAAWTRAVTEAGATAPTDQIEQVGLALLARWGEPERYFHNTRHLIDLLALVDEIAHETHCPALVRLAVFYHGAIFDAAGESVYAERSGEDVLASSRLAFSELSQLGVPPRRAGRIRDLLIALNNHAPIPGDGDGAVLCDADLAILAAEPQRYKDYVNRVRQEFSHVPLRTFLSARIAILGAYQARPTLFRARPADWETRARQNIAAELQWLVKERLTLDREAVPGPAASPSPAEPGLGPAGA